MTQKYDIIDVHTHLGIDSSNLKKNLVPTEQTSYTLLQKMNNAGINKAVVFPFPGARAEFNSEAFWFDVENKTVLNEAATSNDRFIPFGAVNPNDSESIHAIKTMAGLAQIQGVKIAHQNQLRFSTELLVNNQLMPILEEHALPILIHIGTGKERLAADFHCTLDYAITVARHYPHITFIFAHLGRLHYSMLDALALDNVFFDTSALSMWHSFKDFLAEEPLKAFEPLSPVQVIEQLVDLGWKNRLLFGSDEPYVSYLDEMGCIKNADISENAKRAIFAENTRKVVGRNK
jgi:predicted TIM-barrel fold metal-dependent hydrolase